MVMETMVHLILVADERLRPNLEGLAYWHAREGAIRRLFVYCTPLPGQSREAAERLIRVVREAFPGIKGEIREGSGEVESARRQFEDWHQEAPAASWVIMLGPRAGSLRWAALDWTGRTGARLFCSEREGEWQEIRQPAETGQGLEVDPVPDLPRPPIDPARLAGLVRAMESEEVEGKAFQFGAPTAADLPLVPLTDAAMVRHWQWRDAFRDAGIDLGPDSAELTPDALFARYLVGLLASFGIARLAIAIRRPRTPGPQPGPARTTVWVDHDGPLVVLDLATDSAVIAEDSGVSEAATRDILEAAMLRRRFSGLDVQWVLIRPGHRYSEVEQALLSAHGLRWIDESRAVELPSHLAGILERPLPPEAAEVERLLRGHVAESGRVRVFAGEAPALIRQATVSADPAIVQADGLVDQIRRERRQNWLVWTHRGRVFVRLPVDGRANPASDWGLMLSGVSGVPLERMVIPSGNGRDGAVVFELPDEPESTGRLRDWLRPFLNGAVTFSAAQARFAAQARLIDDLTTRPGPSTRPTGPVASAAPVPARRAAEGPRRDREKERRPPRPTPPIGNPLADLDLALDEALGKKPAAPGGGPQPGG